MKESEVSFRCDDGHVMRGVLVEPEPRAQAEKGAALVLIFEIWGFDQDMVRVARDFAAEGYTIIVPDLFDRGPKARCVAKCMQALALGRGEAVDDLVAARRYLASRPTVDDTRIGVIGFCMGGGFAMLLASKPGFAAAAPFYGIVPRDMPASCPIVASYGARDKPFRGEPGKLRRHLRKLDVPHDVAVYPDAGHAFFTHAGNPIAQVIGPWSPLEPGYHEASAKDAHRRVVAFFAEHLG